MGLFSKKKKVEAPPTGEGGGAAVQWNNSTSPTVSYFDSKIDCISAGSSTFPGFGSDDDDHQDAYYTGEVSGIQVPDASALGIGCTSALTKLVVFAWQRRHLLYSMGTGQMARLWQSSLETR